MVSMRCTSKLLSRLQVKPVAASRPAKGLLGDWYATLLHSRRGQFVLAIAQNTLLPIVVSGRDIRSFPERIAASLEEVLMAFAVPKDAIDRECAAFAEVQWARTDNRSTVGVLTELQRLLHGDLDDHPTWPLPMISVQLAETPIVARDLFPDDATCRLFGVPSLRWSRFEPFNG